MPDTVTPGLFPDVAPIKRLIRRSRLLLRSSWGTTGVGLCAGLALAVLAAVTAVDMLLPLSSPMRFAGLLLFAVPTAWVFLVGVVLPMLRRLGPTDVARRIEARIPGMHNRLVSCVDLTAKGARPQGSPAFIRRLITEALDRIRNFRPWQVVDFASLRKALLFALVSGAVFGGMWALFPDRLPTALARVFAPFADIPPASGVTYSVQPGSVKLLRGEDVRFVTTVAEGDPEELTLVLQSPQAGSAKGFSFGELLGRLRRVFTPMDPAGIRHQLVKQPDGRTWAVKLSSDNLGEGFEGGFTYRVYGGRTWSKQQTITLLERPVIAGLQAAVHMPAYMGIPEPRPNPTGSLDVTGPAGGEVEVTVTAEGQVAEAEVQWLETWTRLKPVADRRERVWFDYQPPKGAQPAGAPWTTGGLGGRRTHVSLLPVAPGVPYQGPFGHQFQMAPDGFAVGAGDNLFVHVYVVPGQEPDTVMLQWQDDTNSWDHRAFWGADKLDLGTRHNMGAMPKAGAWVRLEVPARLVGLEGRSVKGMAFTLYGSGKGKAHWHTAGAGLPAFIAEPRLNVTRTFPMSPAGEPNRFVGRFPLQGEGLYRVELRNELGHANKPMKEAKFAASPDLPPQVSVLRPGADITLSAPGKVPAVIEAVDDHGLLDVWLAGTTGVGHRFERKLLKKYESPSRSESVVATLDLAALGLKAGDVYRYRAEARDRRPDSEPVASREYTIRIAADAAAADKQLEAFEKGQDPFREKLVKLIGEHAKVRQKVEDTAKKYDELSAKVKAAEKAAAAGEPKEPAKGPKTTPQPKDTAPKLDPKTQQELDRLRKELAELARQEQSNFELSNQAAADLNRIAQEAAKMPLLPPEIAAELAALQRQFNQQAVNPLGDLTDQMRRGSDPKRPAPDLENMRKNTDQLQADLEAMKRQMDAIAKAQRDLRGGDLQAAIDQLKAEMLRIKGDLTEQELNELKDYIAKLREDLKNLQGEQGDLRKEAGDAADADLPKVERKQGALEKDAGLSLEDVKKLLESEKARRMRKQNDPKAPYTPEGGEDDPGKNPDGSPTGKPGDPMKGDRPEDADETFAPLLGGERQKVDPRFARKDPRAAPKKKPADPNDLQARRQDLGDRMDRQSADLDAADKALSSDQQTLKGLLDKLNQANQQAKDSGQPMPGQPMPGEPMPGEGSDEASRAMQDLQQMLNSPQLQQAKAMADRMRQSRQQGRQPGQQQGNQPSPNAAQPNLAGTPLSQQQLDALLGRMDPSTRATILQMQPKVREELLQGLKDEGPEAYRKHIQDYFKRLSEVKK